MDRYGNLSDDGEVDHSFFDSEADEESGRPFVSRSRPSKHEHTHDKEDFSSGDSDRVSGTKYGTDKKDSKVESVEPRPSSAVKPVRNSAQNLKLGTSLQSGVPQIRREFEDNYYPDEDDSSEEESRSSRPKTAKQTNNGKKSTKYSRDFPSSISSSDTEFSDAASDGHSPKSLQSNQKERPLFSLFSPDSRSSRQITKDNTDESEDTVTDVTPLSTPDISPIQSFDLAATSEALKSKVKRQENVSQEIYDPDFDGKSDPKTLQDAMDLNNLLKAFMHLDKKEKKSLSLEQPPIRHKKNYSFTNEEVRYIDRENQRLLKELSRQTPKPKSLTPPKKPNLVPNRLYHSALNRQREQQRIERENLALLKRLESVKPTVGMTRTEQFMDYQRQAGYLSSTATSPRPGKTSASRLGTSSSSGGFSRVSSASSRSGHTSSSAALLRPTKSGNVRAAWL